MKPFLILLVVFLTATTIAQAQPMIGFKAGSTLSLMQYKDSDYRQDNNFTFEPYYGFTAGLIFHYRVTKHWGLHTEFNYLTKGREIRRTGSDYLYDRLDYEYLEVPVLFRYTFGNRDIKGFVQAGPTFGYLLRNQGEFSSPAIRGISDDLSINYSLAAEANDDDNEVTAIDNFRNIHIGLDVGVGIALPIFDQRKLLFFDLRYTLLQSYIGSGENLFVGDYVQNYEGSPRSITFTIGMVFGFSNVYFEY